MRDLTRIVVLALALTPGAGAEETTEIPPAMAEPTCAEAIALRVQGYYEAVRDLEARFEQTSEVVTLGGGSGSTSTSRGRVVFAKPGRMRWSYEEPEKSLVVTDGKTLWTYDPLMKEAQKLEVGQAFLSGAAIQFLLGEGRILDSFAVSSPACEDEQPQLELVPLEPASYERLFLRVDRKSGLVEETAVVDLLGNVTRVAFRKVRTNRDPKDETFTFEPPEGTNVIEYPAAQ